MSAIIQARNLTKRYHSLTAVNGINFDIHQGQCFGLLGPNGAGKTSTIRMITCTSPVTDGELWVDGKDVRRQERAIKAVLGVGVLLLVLWRARCGGAGMMAACGLTVLVGMNLTYFWSVRPQLFTYVCFALLIAVSRVVTTVHHPSDVIAGAVVGVIGEEDSGAREVLWLASGAAAPVSGSTPEEGGGAA